MDLLKQNSNYMLKYMLLNLNMTHLRAHFNNNKVAQSQRFCLQIGNAFIEDEQWT